MRIPAARREGGGSTIERERDWRGRKIASGIRQRAVEIEAALRARAAPPG
jgi:hypothetical protein